MSTDINSSILQTRNLVSSYQKVLDLLSDAYWEASDISSKDLIYGVEHAITEIITELNKQQIASITEQFIALKPKIDAVNKGLEEIKADINKITRNISTAGDIAGAIGQVLSMFPL